MDQGDFVPLVRQYGDFLRHGDGGDKGKDRVKVMLNSGSRRLMVSLDDLRDNEESLARAIMSKPIEHMNALNEALREIIKDELPELKDNEQLVRRYHVGIEGSLGANRVSPRGLLSNLVGAMVEVEGIVTRVSLVRPKLLKSVHYNKTKNTMVMREYRDGLASTGMDAVFGAPSAYLTKDDEGNVLETEYGKCEYLDNQRIVLQEMPERAPPGQLPRSIDIIAEDDLVETCKPGDRVRVVGVFRALGGTTTAQGSGVFKTIVLANAVRQIREESTGHVRITEGDTKNIRAISHRGDLYRLLMGSIAPSICGHDYIKKAILLMLLGGTEKNIANGTHLRGDINMLMIGDPSTAKSQLLRFVMHIAPLSVSTTGRGSTGVGLTAAVTHDPDTGDRHLEAGAMVLADRGVVCIDEFDKMSDEDRVAIHEVMEQQTVTIAKAGIHASLNARCSVIAAANPVYGSYDTRKTTYENSALPDSLLSRFDLIFTVLDMMDEDLDAKIANHVLRVHQYRKPGRDTNSLITVDDTGDRDEESRSKQNEDGTSVVFDRNAKTLYGKKSRSARKVLSVDFLRKYVYFAKTKFKPVLTEEAAEFISRKYKELRSSFLNSSKKTLPITARCLETLIRLGTAHAKGRHSMEVTEDDAQEAYNILNFALTHQQANAPSRKRVRQPKPNTEQSDGSDEEGATQEAPPSRRTRSSVGTPSASHTEEPSGVKSAQGTQESAPAKRTSKLRTRRQQSAQASQEAEEEFLEPIHPSAPRSQDVSEVPPSSEEQTALQSSEDQEMKTQVPVDSKTIQAVRDSLNKLTRIRDFCQKQQIVDDLANELTEAQVDAVLAKMSQQQQIMIHDSTIFRV